MDIKNLFQILVFNLFTKYGVILARVQMSQKHHVLASEYNCSVSTRIDFILKVLSLCSLERFVHFFSTLWFAVNFHN